MLKNARIGVEYPTAQIINLADWRKGLKSEAGCQPLFPPTKRPGMDLNQMGHGLAAAARYVREGRIGTPDLVRLLEGLSGNAHAACRVGHDLEFRLLLAERVLSARLGDLEGKALTRAIKEASRKLGKAKRAAVRAARRK